MALLSDIHVKIFLDSILAHARNNHVQNFDTANLYGIKHHFSSVMLNNCNELSKSICLFRIFAILVENCRCANVREYFCTVTNKF